MHSPIVYGLLAHSHSWKGEQSTPEQNIIDKLHEMDGICVDHPRVQLDLLCVADLAAWCSATITFLRPAQVPDWSKLAPIYGPNGSARTAYIGHTISQENQAAHFTPIGALISHLIEKIAWETPSLRNIADYYRIANLSGSGSGGMRMWPSNIYSDEVRPRIEAGLLTNGKPWDEWHVAFN